MNPGTIGQIRGPFASGVNVLPTEIEGDNMIIGVSIPDKELMPYDQEDENFGFYFVLNSERIKVGKQGMYEMDTPLRINSLVFPKGASKETKVEYRIYE